MTKRILLALCLIPFAGCTMLPVADLPPEKEYALLPLFHCTSDMDAVNYWIKKYANPDEVLLTLKQIEEMNRKNHIRGLLTDVFTDKLWDYKYIEMDRPGEDNPEWDWNLDFPSTYCPGVLEGYTLFTYLKDETERIKRRQRWDKDGWPVAAKIFRALDKNLNLYALRESNPIRYAITLRRTNVRYYPTDMLITGKRWDDDFDIVQVSSLRALEPLAILHVSRDEEWVFVVTSFCRGWVKRQDILEGYAPKDLQAFVEPDAFIVVTGHKVDAVFAPGNTKEAETFYMGTRCPLQSETRNYYVIRMPGKTKNGKIGSNKLYIAKNADVNKGFIACTRRNLLLQAFKLLHTTYSWGGRDEHRDCSQFVMDIYATMGIILPRNSSAQGRVGSSRYTFTSGNSIRQRQIELDGIDYPVMLQFPGHIMLYLGSEGGHYYAIHDIWAYRVPDTPGKDRKVVIGQVVVSDLSLGADSSKGSLLQRITTINLLHP